MSEKEEILAYHERCKAVCAALNLELAGFTPGKGMTYNIPELPMRGEYGDHSMPHALLERIEKIIKSK